MKFRMGFLALLLAALTGCGGSVSFTFGNFSVNHPFVVWAGNSNRDVVVDANNDAFAFFTDNGCLHNFQTGRENRDFCLASTGDTVLYGSLRMRVAIVHSVTGACIAALLDAQTANFVDVEVDTNGREVVFITQLHPDPCLF